MDTRIVDLRSDTVTQPTPEMRRAMADAEVGDDVMQEDPTVNRLQELAADKLGKQAALFIASGTMGNLLAVLAHATRGDEAILGNLSHTFLFEGGGMAALAGVSPYPLPNQPDGTLRMEDIRTAIRSKGQPSLPDLAAADPGKYTQPLWGVAPKSGIHPAGRRTCSNERAFLSYRWRPDIQCRGCPGGERFGAGCPGGFDHFLSFQRLMRPGRFGALRLGGFHCPRQALPQDAGRRMAAGGCSGRSRDRGAGKNEWAAWGRPCPRENPGARTGGDPCAGAALS